MRRPAKSPSAFDGNIRYDCELLSRSNVPDADAIAHDKDSLARSPLKADEWLKLTCHAHGCLVGDRLLKRQRWVGGPPSVGGQKKLGRRAAWRPSESKRLTAIKHNIETRETLD